MEELIEKRAPYAGAQIHQVTPILDEGPPWTYFVFPVSGKIFEGLKGEELFNRLREEELKREFPLILITLKLVGEEALSFSPEGGPVTFQGKPMPGGLDISNEVEEFLFTGKLP